MNMIDSKVLTASLMGVMCLSSGALARELAQSKNKSSVSCYAVALGSSASGGDTYASAGVLLSNGEYVVRNLDFSLVFSTERVCVHKSGPLGYVHLYESITKKKRESVGHTNVHCNIV
jgi:hypothetical protein